MPVPRSIQVGPYTFTVHADAKHWLDAPVDGLGLTDFANLTIKIRPGLPPDLTAETLLHEVLHAAWWASVLGRSNDTHAMEFEENVVGHLAPALLDTFRRNPELLIALGTV